MARREAVGAEPKATRGGNGARLQRSAARREAILAAALDEFSAQGFAAARLDDVARRAGVAKGTIYLHFRDKEALFQELIRSVLGPIRRHARADAEGRCASARGLQPDHRHVRARGVRDPAQGRDPADPQRRRALPQPCRVLLSRGALPHSRGRPRPPAAGRRARRGAEATSSAFPSSWVLRPSSPSCGTACSNASSRSTSRRSCTPISISCSARRRRHEDHRCHPRAHRRRRRRGVAVVESTSARMSSRAGSRRISSSSAPTKSGRIRNTVGTRGRPGRSLCAAVHARRRPAAGRCQSGDRAGDQRAPAARPRADAAQDQRRHAAQL